MVRIISLWAGPQDCRRDVYIDAGRVSATFPPGWAAQVWLNEMEPWLARRDVQASCASISRLETKQDPLRTWLSGHGMTDAQFEVRLIPTAVSLAGIRML